MNNKCSRCGNDKDALVGPFSGSLYYCEKCFGLEVHQAPGFIGKSQAYEALLSSLDSRGVPWDFITRHIMSWFDDWPVNKLGKQIGTCNTLKEYPNYEPVRFLNNFNAWRSKNFEAYNTPKEKRGKISKNRAKSDLDEAWLSTLNKLRAAKPGLERNLADLAGIMAKSEGVDISKELKKIKAKKP